MALIQENIPTQNFEICKHRIAFILKEEINNQISKINENIEVPIYLDRKNQVSNSENITVNISLLEGEYSESTRVSAEGLYVFAIDIYANTQSESIESSNVVDLIYGWVRYILSHPEYKTLDFPRGFIAGTYVRSFMAQEKLLIGDADEFDVKSVRFECRINENQLGVNGVELLSNYTNFKICNSNKGYLVVSEFLKNGDFNPDFNKDFLIN